MSGVLLAGSFLEVSIFAVFAVAYAVGAWRLLQGCQSRAPRWRNLSLFAANTCMLALAAAHLGITLELLIYDFNNVGILREDIDGYLPSVNQRLYASQYYLYVTQTLIGDSFMLYRLYVVAQGKWRIIIVPSILFVFDIACGYMDFLLLLSRTAFFSISFITNMLCTIMIMACLFRLQGSLVQSHWNSPSRVMFNLARYRPLIEAVIESAAIYSLASISLLITILVGDNIGYSVGMCVFPPLIGAVFALMVIQIAGNSASRHLPAGVTPSDATASAALNMGAVRDFETRPNIRKDAELSRTISVPLHVNRGSEEEVLAM